MKKRDFSDLGEFVAALEKEGELLRITSEVSPILEITEITNRASKSPGGGKALLFERVAGSSMPVITNAFGSAKRICMALGVERLDELGEELKSIIDMAPPSTLGDKIHLLKDVIGWSRFLPRTKKISAPPCQEVVLKGDDVDIDRIPILQCWPKDAGRFVTLPLVFTKNLRGQRNVGMYRLQQFDKKTMGMHWHVHKDGAHYFHEYRRQGRRMEVAVAIGSDPAVTYAATAPMPKGVDEMLLAGFIRKKPVVMVKGVTVDIEVPAFAEIILEGYVDPEEQRVEGPFGDHTGFYSAADLYPVFHVTAITHRKNAMYSATVVGKPPMEDCYLALATERIFLPLVQTILPEITDYRLPWEGVFHNLALVSMDKHFPGQAMRVAHGLWGSGQMSFCKAIFTFDSSVDISKGREAARLLLDTIDLEKDLLLSAGVLDVLDHASDKPLFGGKMSVDVTKRLAGEEPRRIPVNVSQGVSGVMAQDSLARINPGFVSCRVLFSDAIHPLVLVSTKGELEIKKAAREILESDLLPSGAIIALFDAAVNLADDAELLWYATANTDPGRDIFRGNNRLLIDARAKRDLPEGREWPEEIRMDRGTREKVTARTEELGIGEYSEPGAAHYE